MSNLSKSKLLAFRQCPKRLWLEIHKPELKEDSAATTAAFRNGNQVGEVARRIYDPVGIGITIDAQRDGYASAFARTRECLAKGDRPVFEAGLRIDGALAFADVMLPERIGGSVRWKMVEVKSSTSVKDYHLDDIAIQSLIAVSSGVSLSSVSVACVDSSWVYQENGDYLGLLKETDLTHEALSRGPEAAGWISEAQMVASLPSEPVKEVGDHCSTPFPCGFIGYCNRDRKQAEYPLNWLPRLSATRRAALAAQGIDDLRNAPNDSLSEKQQRVKDQSIAGTIYFDAAGAAADLASHGLPAYFLDFETVNPAVPLWKGTRPYEQIPFQFSLHSVGTEGNLTHASFLDLSGSDPSLPLSIALLGACGAAGPIFVYNAAFEKTRIRELAKRFPSIADGLTSLIVRIVDLMPIASNRYYHPSQKGSWSIKAVLPAVAPDLSYGSLPGVSDGAMAVEAYHEAIQAGTTLERRETIRRELDAYCRLDTFAMVRLWHFFSGRGGPAPIDQP